MFKIESYITSIILANADKYIKNFRKQDAQVSLWEGDATFHNIDLNVDALNEELQSSFLITSGYIHDLTIHVPWTKLMSESVIISVNTIECVARLKSKDEKLIQTTGKCNERESTNMGISTEKRVIEEESPPSSYISAITNKIMNNLSVRCENVILKLVEEDIVFSMNIEKLSFDNVNEAWVQSMTDVNMDKLLTRKLITLSGVTICLDKQNSSGRIDTYLEPLLYRCLIYIRLLRGYDCTFSKKPIYTHLDILSNKMSFTISEPQIPMLLKLGVMIFGISKEQYTSNDEINFLKCENTFANSILESVSEETVEDNESGTTWSDWLWSMVPSILPQENNFKQNKKINTIFHVGFHIKILDINIKLWSTRSQKKPKLELGNLFQCKFLGFMYRMMMQNNEWFNVQFGVSHLSVEVPCDESDYRIKQILSSGIENADNFMKGTLFDDDFCFSTLKIHNKPQDDSAENVVDQFTVTNQCSDFDCFSAVNFSLNNHLNCYTENALLERTAAFAIDYVKIYRKSSIDVSVTSVHEENNDNDSSDDSMKDLSCTNLEQISKVSESMTLMRFIFGGTVIRVTTDMLSRIMYLHKIILYDGSLNYRHSLSDTGINQRVRNNVLFNNTTQFTFFDFSVELHVSSSSYVPLTSSNKDFKFMNIPETFPTCHSTPVVILFCKCIDGSRKLIERSCEKSCDGEICRITSIKTAEIICSLLQMNQRYDLLKCEKLDWENSENMSTELRLEMSNVTFNSSKPNILVVYYIVRYLLCTLWKSEEKQSYYSKLFYSSLLDDTFLLDNTVLEIMMENVVFSYVSIGKTYGLNLVIRKSKAYASKLLANTAKRTMIFTTWDTENESESIRLMFQHCQDCNEKCSYPSCIWFNVASLDINLDLIFYSWCMYKPVSKILFKTWHRVNKNVNENSMPKNVPNRKISNGSSGSQGRKCSTNYPKPKESVHSSSEPEVHSPLEITDTETSDVCQIVNINSVSKEKEPFIQYLANKIRMTSSYIISGEISQLSVYFPTSHVDVLYNEHHDKDRLISELFRNTSQNCAGIVKLFLKSFRIKCDIPLSSFSGLEHKLISVSKDIWSFGKLLSPWRISFTDMNLDTLFENKITKSLLKPLSIDCTVGMSFRDSNNLESAIALCVHFDFQPIFIDLTEAQVLLISAIVEILNNIYFSMREVVMTPTAANEMSNKSSLNEISDTNETIQNKLTGWIQWTFRKVCLSVHSTHDARRIKLCLEVEDSIVSLEFDEVFHKLKLKIASFGIYHRERYSKTEPWRIGAFYGSIIQKCYSKSQNSSKLNEDDTDDRFLLATITRARSSNLQTRLVSSLGISEITTSFSNDRYVTEIILNMSATDIILPFHIIEKFLLVLKPLIHVCQKSYNDSTELEIQEDVDSAIPCLPLVYFDIPTLRIFIPLSKYSPDDSTFLCDTIVFELNNVYADCEPKYPIVRKPLHSKTFHSILKNKYALIDQKLQNQQYQIFFTSISIHTSTWHEIERMILEEQSSVEKPLSAFEQNPAVMWNQGCHPGSKNKINFRHLTPIISKFSCLIQIAPSVQCFSLKTSILGPYFEVSVLTGLRVTVSLQQIVLLIALYEEYVKCIAPYFEYTGSQGPKISVYSTINTAFSSSRVVDSGIESVEQSSVASSVISKNKSEAFTPSIHRISAQTVKIPDVTKNSQIYQHKIATLKEVYISAPLIRVMLYTTTCSDQNNEKRTVFNGLMLCELHQPFLYLSNENGYPTIQGDIFNISLSIPDLPMKDVCSLDIPTQEDFELKILIVQKSNCDPYSRVMNSFFTLKMIQNLNGKWKVECHTGQPVIIDCCGTIMQYLLSSIDLCVVECKKYMTLFSNSELWYNNKTSEHQFLEKLNNQFNHISSFSLSTSRLVMVFRSSDKTDCLVVNLDAISIFIISYSKKSPSESISIRCGLKAVTVSLPRLNSIFLCNILSKEEKSCKAENYNLLSNLVLKPLNMNVKLLFVWQRWNLFRKNPWKCLKIDLENIVVNVNPLYVEKLSTIVSHYCAFYAKYFSSSNSNLEFVSEEIAEETNSEFYKDDLRAGAFQYVKTNDTKSDLPSPYEVLFYNYRVQSYMSWRYPQPRSLTRLQIYPIPHEEVDEVYDEEHIHCQLQYYNELTNHFHTYISFDLCENAIQNVALPKEKPKVVAAECWRIVLLDNLNLEKDNNFKIDIRSLVGCVRVDSVFQPTLVPTFQFLMNIIEIQLNFSVLCQNESIIIDQYSFDYCSSEQLFLSVSCTDVEILLSNFKTDNILNMSGIGKISILNYEYLMLQSFVDPFSIKAVLHTSKNDSESSSKFACKMKTIHIRISPSFIHTLSVAQNLWYGWSKNSLLPWKITAPFVMCNNTNHVIRFHQEGTLEEIYLSPFLCHLFAWSNPDASKLIKITIFSAKRKYTSEPLNIKNEGHYAVKCNSTDDESCMISVSVIKHSSVVHQVIIQGSLLMYNVTQSQMDICVVSYGKTGNKNKLSSSQLVAGTSLLKHQLLSMVLPLDHKLSFKVRFSSSQNDSENCQWSGLISLVIPQKFSNQTAWMVKIPLKGLREHFLSLWCQITWELIEGLPQYLVVFRPLCTVISFLPWKSYVKISNDLGSLVNTSLIADKGDFSDLFIPDTISLDKYTIEFKLTENSPNILSEIKLGASPKQKLASEINACIHTVIKEISDDIKSNNWPFLNDETVQFCWKTDHHYQIKPTVKVSREERNGCGIRIELYPWAIIINMLKSPVILDISNTIYTIEPYEIIAPPCIESTFKLGFMEKGQNYLSGFVQLSDDQSFPIPKVTGRIPLNGFITTMIDCDDYVTFVNVTSKNYKEMRIISICTSYVINNSSSYLVNCSAWVVCHSGNKTSTPFDIPASLMDRSISLANKENTSVGQSIIKWYKMGSGDVQILPYLILSVNGNIACPVRICDLSEKQRYPIIFSSCKISAECTPCIFITAQQSKGQVFLTVWDETVPQITIHNKSQLSLNIISSKSENVKEISYCLDWNWKFIVATQSSAHFCIQKQVSEKHKARMREYLMFSVENSKHIKQTKLSSGVLLKPCVNQLITLPMSQHHIKISIFRDGFTFVVWIESATTDELSAKMIRARLSESLLTIEEEAMIPLIQENSNLTTTDEFRIPPQLIELYNDRILKVVQTNIAVEEILFTIAYDDKSISEERDIATFCAKNILFSFNPNRSSNEVTEQILCCIDIGEYQLVNDEYHLRAFDFPIILLNQPVNIEPDFTSEFCLEDLLTYPMERKSSALKINVCFIVDKRFMYDVRDLHFTVLPISVYLEDGYMLKLRTVLENIFSASTDSSTFEEKFCRYDEYRSSTIKLNIQNNKESSVDSRTTDKEETCNIITAKVKSSSSKSVNVSECDTEDKNSVKPDVCESNLQHKNVNQRPAPNNDPAGVTNCSKNISVQSKKHFNCILIPREVMKRSKVIARPLRLRSIYISSFNMTVSLHTSTTFYIALDRSPLTFSEFKKDYLITTPFELGNLLVVHYFLGAIYGTGWAISSLEFVGSPGILARNVGTGIKDFVSLPIYGIASGPRGFVLGIAHGSASLMKHVMAGTLSSVTNFAGSWARTLNRFTLDTDDLLQSEQIRRIPPSSIVEGILQGLSEFGISLLGGISGIAHHPLQYAMSNTTNRSLFNSISLGIVGVLTRPLSGAAELVARTGQGIMSHVGWNTIPMVRNGTSSVRSSSNLQICDLKFHWKREYNDVLFTIEAVDAQNITSSLWIILTRSVLYVVDVTSSSKKFGFELEMYEFHGSDVDPTLITVQKPVYNFKIFEDFSRARIYKFINDTNQIFNISCQYATENQLYLNESEIVYSFFVNPQTKNFLLNMITFVKSICD